MKPNVSFALLGLGGVALVIALSQQDTPEVGHSPAQALTKAATPSPIVPSIAMLPKLDWKPAVVPKLTKGVPFASTQVKEEAIVPLAALPELRTLKKGELVSFPVRDGEVLPGVVTFASKRADGVWAIAGKLAQGMTGEFSFARLESGEVEGLIQVRDTMEAYQLTTHGEGQVQVLRRPLDSVVCASMPLEPNHIDARADQRSAAASTDAAVPDLQSRPGVSGVLYLDFDGEIVTDPNWNGGFTINAAPAILGTAPISAAQMSDVWARVSEDMRPFNVNVTTTRALYDAAPAGQRMHCVITPTTDAAPSAGGVAYRRSYLGRSASSQFSDDIVCWSFNSGSTAVMAMTISHELGHTLNLSHDGSRVGSSTLTYYGGHGSGVTGWGPIMGAPFSKPLVQWSIGDYVDANNFEDDFGVAASTVAFRRSDNAGMVADDAGDTIATANTAALNITGAVDHRGLIGRYYTGASSSAADADYFRFQNMSGPVTFTVTPTSVEPNLDGGIELRDSSNTVVASGSVSTTSLASTVTVPSLPAGIYYVVVRGKGRAPISTGYSDYGSEGDYRLTGTWVPLPAAPLFTVQPIGGTYLQGSRATLAGTAISSKAITYQWKKNGVALPGKTANTLLFTSIQPADAGTYTLEATSGVAPDRFTTASTPAVIIVEHKPIITTQPGPLTQSRPQGSTVTFTAAVTAVPPVSNWQWRRNGVDIPGANASTLALTNINWFSAGSYTVVATNAVGATASTAAALVVTASPYITVHPPTVTKAALNGTAVMSVTAVGSPPLTYQWFKGGVAIPGQVRSVLALPRVQFSAEASYHCVVSNTFLPAAPVASNPTVLDVQNPPLITGHPLPVTQPAMPLGSTITYTVTASGTDTLSYQWQLNNINVPGANAATLTIPSALWIHGGAYRCVVTNDVGTAISRTAVVSVTSPAVILTQPLDTKVARGGTAVLKVVAGGTPALKYQWFKEGTQMPGAVAASLTLARASTSTTDGLYAVRVTNGQPGEVFSRVVSVETQEVPIITTHPRTQAVAIGESVTLSVAHSGTRDFTYQWQKNNVTIPGEINATLVLTNAQIATTNGVYRVIVKNAVGTATSLGATITAMVKPAITTHPTAQVLVERDTLRLTVTATGTAVLSYQWRKDSVNLPTTIPSARTAALSIPLVTAANAGAYDCVVTNAVGSATSNTAAVTVNPIPSPVLSYITPSIASPGAFVDVVGKNLRFTKSVTIVGRTCAFVIVDNTELRVTVPAGAAATGDLVVTTWAAAPSSNTLTTAFTVQAFDPSDVNNDAYANARIASGLSFSIRAYNRNASRDGIETTSYSRIGASVWFRWRVPTTGTYDFNTVGSSVDTVLGLHLLKNDLDPLTGLQGVPNPLNLPILAANDNETATSNASRIRIPLAQGNVIYIMVDGALAGRPSIGSFLLKGAYVGAAAVPSALAGPQSVTSSQSEAIVTDAMPAAPQVVASTRFTIRGQGTSAWTVYDRRNEPAFALIFDTQDHSIAMADSTGLRTALGQTFLEGQAYDLQLHVNSTKLSWTALLNGISIAKDQPMPAGTAFGDLTAQWQGNAGGIEIEAP